MTLPFAKLHGAKNDFILTPASVAPPEGLPALAIAICDRYTGIGADGWMLVDETPGDGYDATIRLFNSDGSEAELSGNGTRCAAHLLLHDKPETNEIRIRTASGIKHLRVIERRGLEIEFEMNMGNVRVVQLSTTVQGRDAVIVDPGNPQCAFPVEDFDFNWRAVGAATERDPLFPNRTNVSFVRKLDDHTIDVRFWERGAGETNSSGTGSTGAATAAVARGMVTWPVTVVTPAGNLTLRSDDSIYLTGPAEVIAEGIWFYGKIDSNE
ncbi:MAG: diaminopimelate epimerase [Acidobacteriia bacterium]|jgi:diaminopimelate epimerase|nr:diaminopimelate epimerase [Terriglobia bacterium]